MKWLPSCLLVSIVSGGLNTDPYHCPPCPVTMVCLPCFPVVLNPGQRPPQVELSNAASPVALSQPLVYLTSEPDVSNYPSLPGRRVIIAPPSLKCQDYLCKAIMRRRQHLRQDDYKMRLLGTESHHARTEKVTRRKCRFIHECETVEVTKYRN